MRLDTQLEKLLIYDPDQSRTTVHIFVAHPTPVEEQSLGRLIMLVELDPRQPSDQDFIHALQHELSTTYYGSDALHPETAFESTLAAMNQRIGALVADYAYNWHEHLNIVVGVHHGDQLIFADYGNIHIFLIHAHRIIDVLSTAEGASTSGRPATQGRGSPLKVFSNIVSGKVRPGESMVFTTTALMDYFSQEKLRRLITERSPSEAVGAIENILSENINNTSFATLLLTTREVQTASAFRTEPLPYVPTSGPVTAPQASMDQLIQREQKMQEFLSPSLVGNLRKNVGGAVGRFFSGLRSRATKKSQGRRGVLAEELHDYASPYREKKEHARSGFVTLVIGAFRLFARGAGTIFAWMRDMISRRKKSAINPGAFVGTAASLPSRLIIFVKGLSRRNTVLFIAALIIIFAFAQGIVSSGSRQSTDADTQSYDETITRIEDLILEAELALTYDNTPGARDQIQQAQTLISELPQRTAGQKENVNRLNSSIAPLLERANGIQRIDSPIVAGDFGTLGDVSVAGITVINSTVYAFSPAENTIYAIERDAPSPEVFAKAATAPAFQYMVSPTSNNLLFFTARNGITEFTISGKGVRDLAFTFSAESPNVVDIDQYEGRLYLLDISNNQIWRAVRGGNGFGTTSSWIQDTASSIRNARSLAIDGSIYVLTDAGAVLKFTRGQQEQFALQSIEPVLTSGTKIWTDAESDKLYVLDANGKRLVIFSKDGQLAGQYVSDAFDGLRDLAIDEQNSTAYLLNGSKVFAVPLQ